MGKYQIWLDAPVMPGNFRPISGTYCNWNNLYLGNKMTGKPYFNTPWFDASAKVLLSFPTVQCVFNPAHHDRQMGFDPMKCPNGSPEESRAAGFDLHEALRADWEWIAKSSNGMIAGPSWHDSPGTISEIACHQALRLPVWEYQVFCAYWDKDHLYEMALPPIMELGGPKPSAKYSSARV
jgi:hypothetical protein